MTASELKGLADTQPLAGRHAVVTGGGRGIGLAVADLLAKLGADVTIMGRNQATLDRSAAELDGRYGTRVAAERLDVTNPALIEVSFRQAADRLGKPAILVNNAGIARAAPFSKTTLDLWQEVMATDLTGAFLCIRQVIKGMIDGGYGRIVNVASTAGLSGYPYVTAYCAAKHGMIGMTRALAREVAKTAVTVNSVCPGYTNTDIVEDALTNITSKTGRSREDALGELVSHNPQSRLIEPREVAETVAWLCLPVSASVTGQSILVAGGELM